MDDFERFGNTIIHNTQLGFKASAQIGLRRTLSIVPDILRDQSVPFIAELIGLVWDLWIHDLSEYACEFIGAVVHNTIINYSDTHPLVLVLNAMWRSSQLNGSLAEVLLRSGVDLLSMRIGCENPSTSSAIRNMVYFQRIEGDFYSALKYSKKMYIWCKDQSDRRH